MDFWGPIGYIPQVERTNLGNGFNVGRAEVFQISSRKSDWIVMSFIKIGNNRVGQGLGLGWKEHVLRVGYKEYGLLVCCQLEVSSRHWPHGSED